MLNNRSQMTPGTSLRHRRGFVLLALLAVALGAGGQGAGISDRAFAAAPGLARPALRSYPANSVRWGFYITYNPNSWVSLQANAAQLNYVSPWFYNLDANGQVTGKDRPEVGALLKQVGAKNLPMLKNTPSYNDFTAILTDTNKQIAIVNQVDNLIAANGYDGITIDFEAINGSDSATLTAFMGRLYARLHPKGKLVAMAVAAKIRDGVTGWSGAYDYRGLGPVLDYLLIMAYDFHWVNSDPGPIAPINRLRDTANYAITRLAPSKIIWGVGVYGYDWGNSPTGGGDGKPAEYRNFTEVSALALTQGAQAGYDQDSQSPWVRYNRGDQAREVWYENHQSFDAKLGLIADYGLAGFALWRLGQEDPGIWDSINGIRRPVACAPVDPPSPPSAGTAFFPETGHSLKGTFLQYWRAHGGLPIYGYPVTEEFTEINPTDSKPYTVQYFERNRFEFHSENRPPNNVLLGLLGVQVTSGRTFPAAGDPITGPDVLYFPQVRHTLGGPFLQYWQRHGGLAQFGFPISEPVLEQSATDGQTYTVQYMQRARFELHPEYKGTDAEVLLGLLGLNVVPCN